MGLGEGIDGEMLFLMILFVFLILLGMNPENRGEHIGLRHSYLWRNSMFVNDDGPKDTGCHKQLN